MARKVLVFVHAPKTGGSTVTYILRRSFGLRHVDVISLQENSRKISERDLALVAKVHGGRVSSLAGHGFRPNDVPPQQCGFDFQRFTMVRDPLELKLSWVQYRLLVENEKDVNVRKFLLRNGTDNFQTRRIAGEPNLQKAIDTIEETMRFVGRTERFDHSMRLLKEEFEEFPLDISYRRKNTASTNSVKDKLRSDDELMSRMKERDQLDRELCQYVDERFLNREPKRSSDEALAIKGGFPSLSVAANRLQRNLIYKPAVAVARRSLKSSE